MSLGNFFVIILAALAVMNNLNQKNDFLHKLHMSASLVDFYITLIYSLTTYRVK